MSKAKQSELCFSPLGGARAGAGRKPSGPRSRVAHSARESHSSRNPLHVTVRLVDGLPSLRETAAQNVLRNVFRDGANRFGLRLVHFSAQSNHLHMIVEAEDREALTRGMKGLGVRIARGLNRLWNRAGAVLADRFHTHALRTPREVRNALAYVLHNAAKQGLQFAGLLDPCSSAAAFDGWRDRQEQPKVVGWLARAETWLLKVGWRRHGLIPVAPSRPRV